MMASEGLKERNIIHKVSKNKHKAVSVLLFWIWSSELCCIREIGCYI